MSVLLDYEGALLAYQVIPATGYRVELAREPYLRNPGIVQALWVEEGYSVLDDQSSIPGLYFTGQTATRGFGTSFGVGTGCPPAPWVFGNAPNR